MYAFGHEGENPFYLQFTKKHLIVVLWYLYQFFISFTMIKAQVLAEDHHAAPWAFLHQTLLWKLWN